jgi:hypothetical protein
MAKHLYLHLFTSKTLARVGVFALVLSSLLSADWANAMTSQPFDHTPYLVDGGRG